MRRGGSCVSPISILDLWRQEKPKAKGGLVAIVTITLEDREDGKIKMTSDPQLTVLKENASKNRMMTPAVAYAMTAISAIIRRHRELDGQRAVLTQGTEKSPLWTPEKNGVDN